MDKHLNTAAQSMNYGGAAGAITIWHLGIADWAAIISACAAVVGVGLQFWLALRKRARP